MIQIENVSLFYESYQALKNIRLSIDREQITGLIGPNGAGKTSLIRVILGLIQEFSGEVRIQNHSAKKDRQWIKQHCGYAPEETHIFPYLTCREFLRLIATLRKLSDSTAEKEIGFLIDLFEMREFCDTLIVDYSHGMRQKMILSSALLGQPDYLFIDEALNGLDTISLFRLKQYLQKLKTEGKTVVIASHVIPLISDWCDSIVIMEKGNILHHLSRKEIDELITTHKKSFEEIFFEMITAGNSTGHLLNLPEKNHRDA
ncbi:MAG: ABC transporter ATP-binding protein [Calditrichaeota bacterium]|nr:ABC transporter ATP-binding protein [Calditrichota bacterium]